MYDNNYIGNKIKSLRNQLGMKTTAFAKLINSSTGYISDIESGRSIPSIPKLITICQALNITLAGFFNEGDEPTPLTPEIKELVDGAKNLNQEQLELLSKFIQSLK